MQEEIIEFKTAKLAKEKGCHIISGYSKMYNQDGKFGSPYKESYPAYTQSLLQKWLREVHDVHISLNYEAPNYSCNIGGYDNRDDFHKNIELKEWLGYEEALEVALQKSLKLI